MTNKEAIEILLDMANELQLIPESKQGQAFKVAIKALEQEPCEDKLYDIFSRIIDDMYNELSSVKPQENTGHWINGNPICPCCGEDKFKDLDADIWDDWQPKYCPNCGARMESEES